MEYAACMVLGYLLAAIPVFIVRKTRSKGAREPTEQESRQAAKALREYRNFMNYDGFTDQQQ